MIEAKFTSEMVTIIKEMIGETFCSYECGDMFSNEVYGNLQINLKGYSIEFLNVVKEIPFYDDKEEISYFSCMKKELSKSFQAYCNESSQIHQINERILSVSIIGDTISVNNGEYEICFDMAIIVETNKHKYVFSRGWFFSETIEVSVDKNFDDIYPISKVIEDWADGGENKVDVIRTIKKL